MKREEINKEIFELRRVAEENPNSAQAHNSLGLIYGKYRGEYEKARDEFKKAVRIDSKLVQARSNLAIAYYLLGDYDLAWKQIKVLRLLDGSPDQGFVEALMRGRSQSGAKAAGVVGWGLRAPVLRARRVTLVAVVLVTVVVGTGLIYFSRKGIKYGRRSFISTYRSDLIESFLAEGQFDEAISESEHALKTHPTNATIYNLLAQAYHGKQMWDEEIRERKKVVEFDPNWPKTELAALHNNLGVAYIEKGEYDLAIEECKKATKIWPGNAEAYTNLGFAYGQKGEWSEAVKMHSKAVELKADFKEAHYNLALSLAHTGRYEDAWKEAKLAEELGHPAQPLINELKKVLPEAE